MNLSFLIFLTASSFISALPVTRSQATTIKNVDNMISEMPPLADPIEPIEVKSELENLSLEDDNISLFSDLDPELINEGWEFYCNNQVNLGECSKKTVATESIIEVTREEFIELLKLYGYQDLEKSGFIFDIATGAVNAPKPSYYLCS